MSLCMPPPPPPSPPPPPPPPPPLPQLPGSCCRGASTFHESQKPPRDDFFFFLLSVFSSLPLSFLSGFGGVSTFHISWEFLRRVWWEEKKKKSERNLKHRCISSLFSCSPNCENFPHTGQDAIARYGIFGYLTDRCVPAD